MNDKEKVKETLKEMYPQYSGFIEHTLVAEMCLKYHEKQCHIADVVRQSEQLLAFKTWEAEKCKLPWDASPEQIIEQYLSQ